MSAEYWQAILERMERGDTDSARRFLEECIFALANGELTYHGTTVPAAVTYALAEKLSTLYEAPDPWDKPLLRRQRARPLDHVEEETQRKLARLIGELHKRGEPIQRAQRTAAEVFFPETHPDVRIARAVTAWRKFGKTCI